MKNIFRNLMQFIKSPECLYCREYDPEQDDDEDVKTNGRISHFSSEFCRLDKILESCQIGKKTNLEKGLISEKHLKTLREQREKAFQLSVSFDSMDLF